MKKRLFPFLIGLSALAVSGSAAFYSVFGLSKLFAGASLQVIIIHLEVSMDSYLARIKKRQPNLNF